MADNKSLHLTRLSCVNAMAACAFRQSLAREYFACPLPSELPSVMQLWAKTRRRTTMKFWDKLFGRSKATNWYAAQDARKHLRQVVVLIPSEAEVVPRVSNLTADPSTARHKSFGSLGRQRTTGICPLERFGHCLVEVGDELQNTLPQVIH